MVHLSEQVRLIKLETKQVKSVYKTFTGNSQKSWTACLFVWFDSLRPINNLSVIKGRVFLGWTSTKLGLMLLLKDTTQWRRWGSNPRPFGLESSTLPLSHCAPEHACLQKTIKSSRPKFFANAPLLSQVLCSKHYISIYLDEYLTKLSAEKMGQKIPPPPKY